MKKLQATCLEMMMYLAFIVLTLVVCISQDFI